MDKKKPTYPLKQVRELITKGCCKLTVTAQKSAGILRFSQTEVFDVLLSLEGKDFYKSVTEFQNHTVWQDVYKKTVRDIPLYIKFKIAVIGKQMVLVLSFKKSEEKRL